MTLHKIVLVCGGRDYGSPVLRRSGLRNLKQQEQIGTIYSELDWALAEYQFSILIEGEADGADRNAGEWAKLRIPMGLRQVPRLPGEGGYHRNVRMFQLHRPPLVLAFPGGKGTAHMCDYARSQGSEVFYLPRARQGELLR